MHKVKQAGVLLAAFLLPQILYLALFGGSLDGFMKFNFVFGLAYLTFFFWVHLYRMFKKEPHLHARCSCSALLEDLRSEIVKFQDSDCKTGILSKEALRIWNAVEAAASDLKFDYTLDDFTCDQEYIKLTQIRKIVKDVLYCSDYRCPLQGLPRILKDIDTLSAKIPKPSKTTRENSYV